MTDEPDNPALIALATAMSEGATIDWDEAERTAASEPDRQRVQELRELATLVAAHHALGDETAEPAAATHRRWRHLVIFESIGDGAFGTVYRAWDPRLERQVAVKLLKKQKEDASSPLAEARHLARVRHAHVVTVHGADEESDQVGIWMEYIEGQTLAAMIRDQGPMNARETIGVGIDLCSALSALHAAGLLHRDMKAHNVMREVGGRIVLMDFSGASTLESRDGPAVLSGTPLYMAPELFEGGAPSIPGDVYSLGVLLFFLLTGTVPVEGGTFAEIKEAHASRERRDLRSLRPDVAEPMVQVIERATSHDVATRYRTAGELERGLAAATGAQFVPPPVAPLPAAGEPPADVRLSRALVWTAAVAGALAAGVVGWNAARHWVAPATEPPMAQFAIGPPYNDGSWPRLSPDGRLIAFGTFIEGRPRFFIRPIGSTEGRALLNTSARETPFWSPDNRTLAYFADGQLLQIDTRGGDPVKISDAPNPRGGDWREGVILFSTTQGISRVSPDGSRLVEITRLDPEQGDYQHGWPTFLPGGERFLFIIRSSKPERAGLYVASIDGGPLRRIMPAYSRVTFADGQLFFVRESTLYAQAFDPAIAIPSGTPVPLVARVKAHAGGDTAMDVSPAGVLIYNLDPGQPTSQLMLLDRRGRQIEALTEVGSYRQPRFSPDGLRIVAERVGADGNADIWIYGVSRPSAVRLTSDPGPDVRPVWSPDGSHILFSSRRPTNYRVFSKTVDGTSAEEPLTVPPGDVYIDHEAPDRRYISATITRSGLWIIPLVPGQKPWLVRSDNRTAQWQSEFSPDGRWLAYLSEESGTPQVYVEPLPATGFRQQVSTLGGAEPHWRPDSNELYYLATDGTIMTTSVGAPGWMNAKPAPLFRVDVPDLTGTEDYAVSPDGARFVVNTFVADPIVPPIDVVVNWKPLLKP